jgi:hypothetical protein
MLDSKHSRYEKAKPRYDSKPSHGYDRGPVSFYDNKPKQQYDKPKSEFYKPELKELIL